MNTSRFLHILKLVLLLIPHLIFSQKINHSWHLYKNENGISLYSRNTSTSDYKEIKAEFKIKTSLNSVVALIYDWDAYPAWNYRCLKSKTLKKISDKEVIHYQVTDIPWPAEDEDFIIKVSIEQDPITEIIKIKSINMPNYIPPVEDMVRITELYGLWTLIPNKDGTINLMYEFNVKPDKNIPVWLVNAAVSFGPYETILNFKKWVVKDKYQNTNLHLVKELTK